MSPRTKYALMVFVPQPVITVASVMLGKYIAPFLFGEPGNLLAVVLMSAIVVTCLIIMLVGAFRKSW